MAIGDVTIIGEYTLGGGLNVVVCEVASVGSYVAGGIAPSLAKFGLSTVLHCDIEPLELAAATALVARYDRATDKIMLHEGDGPTTAGPLAETDESLAAAASPLYVKAYGHKAGNLA